MPDDPDAALIEKMVAANYGGTSEQALAGIGPFAMDGERDACRRVLDVVREHVGQELAEARAQIAALTAALRVEKGKSDDNA